MGRARRFAFGRNWQSYTEKALTEARLAQAVAAFERLFDGIDLQGRTFLDVGFGQGLATAIAATKGADVLAIDIDPDNLKALRLTASRLGAADKIEAKVASILDHTFVEASEGRFDIVHSWGVLHHTGQMRAAIDNACRLVKPGGYLVIAIYNRHWSSPIWRAVKYLYTISPTPIQRLMIWTFYPIVYMAKWLVTGKDPRKKDRGMDFFHDLVDWVGGYPYEYASMSQVIALVEACGFVCLRTRAAAVPTGCNEFVFRRCAP